MLGTSIGPYRIVEKLGAGGMGEVYLAEDPRLDRRVALKTVSSTSLVSTDARAALLREARAAAKLSHPNIAGVHDVIDQGDRLHIVMEYVEGETAAALARRGRLPVEQVLDVGIQLTEALADAHAHGIVHRDLKPSNIMITPGGRVKVLDFGLAKMSDPAGALRQTDDSTNLAVVAGTLPYIAPERLLRRPADHRVDIYSAGALLFELLTGRLPFEAADYAGMAVAMATSVPPAPDTLDPRVPHALSAAVVRALARDPADRHASAAELRYALERAAEEMAGRETGFADAAAAASDRPAPPRTRRRAQRVGAAAAGALVVIGGLIAWMWASRSSPAQAFRERDWVLIADFDNRTGEPLFDHTLRATLEAALQQSRYVNVVPRTQVFDALRRMRRQDLTRVDEATAIEIGKRENVNVVLAGAAFAAGNTFRISVTGLETARNEPLFVETQQFQHKDELFDRVDALALAVREQLGELVGGQRTQPLAKVTTPSLEALELYSRAVDSIARGAIEDGRALLEGALARDPEFASAHLRLGAVYISLGQFKKALEYYDRAYALRDRVSEREAQTIASTYYGARREYAKSTQSWRVLTQMYPDDLSARFELAKALYENGEFQAAVPEFRHAVRLNPFHGAANARLVLVLARINRPDEAVAAHEEAVSRGIEQPYLHWGLGLARVARNEIAEARLSFARLAQGGEPYRSLGDLYLAQVDSYEGKLAAARDRLEAGLLLDQKHENVANTLLRRYLLGRTWLLQGDRRRAAEQARAIVGTGEQHLFGQNLYQAGTLFVRAGELADARRLLQQLARLRDGVPTGFHRTLFDLLQGELALARGRVEEAVTAFEAAAAGYPRYEALEGLARVHAARGDWARARGAWKGVIAARGHILQVGVAADWPLAHLGLARACRHNKAAECARRSYETFLNTWNTADDLPLRREAEDELRQIVGDARHRR